MAEPALRQLDRDLPKLDMYAPALRAKLKTRRASVADAKTPKRPAKPASKKDEAAAKLIADARALLAQASADRQEAASILADAKTTAATIIAEAQATAAVVTDLGPPLPQVAEIQCAVAARHGISVAALLGGGVGREIVAARYEAIRAAHAARPDLSAAALGRLFRRDHSIVLRAIKMGRAI